MKITRLVWIVLILGALDVGVRYARRPPPPPAEDPRVGQCIVERAGLEQAAEIQVTDAGGTGVRLIRQTDGGWRLDGPEGPPANRGKLSQLVQDLARSRVRRYVGENPDRMAALDFTQTRVALADGAGHVYWSIRLGRISDLGGRYVRFGDEPKAYLAAFEASIDGDRNHWIASEASKVPAN